MQAELVENVSDADLQKVPKRFVLLDRRLSCALQDIATGELGRQIVLATEAELHKRPANERHCNITYDM